MIADPAATADDDRVRAASGTLGRVRHAFTAGACVVTLAGDLDLATVQAVKDYIEGCLGQRPDTAGLVLDLSEVTWLDSVGLGLLVAVRTRCQDRRLTLTLRGVGPRVLRILTLSGLSDLFDLEGAAVPPFPLPDELALPAAPDRRFDQIAELTRRAVDAPRAFVTMVDTERQAFPGAAGVPADVSREEPIAYSLCQYVVTSGEPLVTNDATNDADVRVRTNQAVVEGHLSAYAGMPLRDLSGTIVGTLCVADDEPREWSPAQLATLADLAAVASSELQLRNAVSRAAVSAERERIARDLNGRVFNELLSLSMLLSSAQSISGGRAGELLDDANLKVDEILKSLRATIFDRTT